MNAWDEFRQGTVAVIPAVVAVIPFGLLLGALAAQKGLSPLEVGLMSGLVFAGSAQLVAIDLLDGACALDAACADGADH